MAQRWRVGAPGALYHDDEACAKAKWQVCQLSDGNLIKKMLPVGIVAENLPSPESSGLGVAPPNRFEDW
jgi:hypothetical protein